jgi:hypothetical protein
MIGRSRFSFTQECDLSQLSKSAELEKSSNVLLMSLSHLKAEAFPHSKEDQRESLEPLVIDLLE